MTPKLRKNLKLYKDLLQSKEFDALYSFLSDNLSVVGEFTQLMLDIEINPLKYIKKTIPPGFLFRTDVTYIDIPNNITRIAPNGFRYSMLESINIPGSVVSIGREAFENSLYLKSVKLPNSIKEIAVETFRNCEILQSIDIPKSVIKINNGAFAGCNSLKKVDLKEGLKFIGSNAFRECEVLKEIEIPGSVEILGYRAFGDCLNLQTVKLGKGTKTLGNELFYGCNNISVIYPGTKEEWEDEINILDDTFSDVKVIIQCTDTTFEIDER